MTSANNGRPKRGGPPHDTTGHPSGRQHPTATTELDCSAWRLTSRQVDWWTVHEFVAPALSRAGSWPMAGTPAWCQLADDDPRKLAALLDAARHWALRVDTCQDESAQASRAISEADDWSAAARRLQDRADFIASHPWAARPGERATA